MQDKPLGMERRMVHRLLVHWRNAQKVDETPNLGTVLLAPLGDIEPCLYVLDIRGDEPEFERIGGNLLADGGHGLLGEVVSDAPPQTLLGQAVKYYSKVQIKEIPITLGGEFTHDNGKVILYRSIIAPLCDESGEVGFLLGAANCMVKEE